MAKFGDLIKTFGPYFGMLLLLPFIAVALLLGYGCLALIYIANPPVTAEHGHRWHPNRAFGALSVIGQQVIVAVRMARPLLGSQFRRTRASATAILKDIPYRKDIDTCTMDLHIPSDMSLDGASGKLEGKRVLVFVNGFAFKQGNNEMHFDLAQKLANTYGAVVAVPNVRGHPTSCLVDEMVDDVGASLGALLDMGAKSFDVISHSSGSTLVVLGLLRAAQASETKGSVGWQELRGFRSISGSVFLGGIFDVSMHYLHEWRRGVEGLSCMGLVFNVSKGRACDSVNPVKIIESMSSELLRKMPRTLALHGQCDDVVPETQAVLYGCLMRQAGGQAELIPDEDHYNIAFSLGWPDKKSAVAERIDKFLAGKS